MTYIFTHATIILRNAQGGHMQTYRMFKVKFIGPTNTKGSRLKITDLRYNKSITLSKQYNYSSIVEQAMNYLDSIGIPLDAQSWDEVNSTNYLLTTDISTQLRKAA